MNRVINGFIRQHKDGRKWFEGEIPFGKNERVCLIKQDDLDLLVESAEIIVVQNSFEMKPELYARFPDFLTWRDEAGACRLFLDRHLYAKCFRDAIYVRYQSVDLAFYEGEFADDKTQG